MPIRHRIFFLGDDDLPRQIPAARFDRMYLQADSNECFPEYAGKRVRYALVMIETENRKPVEIKHIDCAVVKFDEEGKIDVAHHDKAAHLGVDMLDAMLSGKPENGPLIDARGRFLRRQYDYEFRWEPTKEIVQAIRDAIFPKKGSPLKLV